MQHETSLDSSVCALSGVGPRLTEYLKRLDVTRIGDLLFHLPIRYQDRTRLSSIGDLEAYRETQFEGTIQTAQIVYGRRRTLVCRVSDGTGVVTLRFFHFSRSQKNRLKIGQRIRCFGEIRLGSKSMEVIHPECRIVDDGKPMPLSLELTPIYPTTDGLHQARLRKLTDQALSIMESAQVNSLPDVIPTAIVRAMGLPDLKTALRFVHRPPQKAELDRLAESTHPAQRRLVFEELLAHQIALKHLRQKSKDFTAPKVSRSDLLSRLLGRFKFELTAAQRRVIDEIERDIATGIPMLRLLQGDVGSGKTAVAAATASILIDAGYQVALMAPTELLAKQHSRQAEEWFGPLGVDTVTLTSRLSKAKRGPVLERLASDRSAFVVGTHALFQNDVTYGKLGLIIVDEQHRFGVEQRLRLRDKGAQKTYRPHQLIMTATPIPRTLAMTAYADLDVSILDELPPGRKPVQTAIIPATRRNEAIERISNACREGRQVYWVCPLITESDARDQQAAIDTAEQLVGHLPDIRVGLVHGRLSDKVKDGAMIAFLEGETDLLVATTVIEVGVDVPNASLMVIDNAERLGLSQLHQLRGRIGRGGQDANCLLLYKTPLSQMAKERLRVIRETTDGFLIAERDLALRGPGEFLGTRQAGASQFRIADLSRDSALLLDVQKSADQIISEYPKAARKLLSRWLASRIEYASV